jgi:hypothetical protein
MASATIGAVASALRSVVGVAVLLGCASDPKPAQTTSTRSDASRPDEDAATGESPSRDGGGGAAAADAAPEDAAGGDPNPWPDAPEAAGVHVSVERRPYETASEAFFYETDRPGIQGQLPDGVTLRVELAEMIGALSCSDGAVVIYDVPEGRMRADAELGSCIVDISAFGDGVGDPIEASFAATVERVAGETADRLELQGRVRVGHP